MNSPLTVLFYRDLKQFTDKKYSFNFIYIYITSEPFKSTSVNAFNSFFIFIIASYGNFDVFRTDLLIFRILQVFKFCEVLYTPLNTPFTYGVVVSY